jgi:hypothetical protein
MSVCDKTMEPMTNRVTEEEKERMTSKNRKSTVASAVTAWGWGLFFIWTGIAVLSDLGWGWGLLGVGIITLGAQVARKYFGLKLEGFWVAVGFFFVLGGVWKLLDVQLGLLPVLCIAVGIILLVSTLVGKPRHSSLCRFR